MKSKLYLSGINNYYDNVYIEKELVNINKNIQLFDRLIKEDDILFGEYIDIINKLYNVIITDNDLFKISSCILGSKCYTAIMDTNILCEVTKSNQINNFFEYIDEEHKLYIKAAFTDSFIDVNHKYTYNEILKLCNENKIVILDFVLDDEGDSYEEITEYRKLTTLKDFTSSFTNLKYLKKEYVPRVYALLKEYFSKDRLCCDFSYYMRDIKSKLDTLDKYIGNLKKGHRSNKINFDDIYTEIKKIRQIKISKDS